MIATPGTPPLAAVVWDFDLTLADTRRRNLSVNRRLISELSGRPWQAFPALADLAAYERAQLISANWQEFYRQVGDFATETVNEAGRRWTPYQLEDPTPAPLIEGMPDALEALAAVPHAVVTQNVREIVEQLLEEQRVRHHFRAILGYYEVSHEGIKPAPDGLLACLDTLAIEGPASVLYVGDHETDMRTVANARKVLERNGRGIELYAVAALFVPGRGVETWQMKPDFKAHSPAEVVAIARSLDGFS